MLPSESSEALKAQLKDLGATIKAKPDAYVEELKYDKGANKFSRTIYINGEKKKEVDAPIGTEVDGQTPDGRACKVEIIGQREGW